MKIFNMVHFTKEGKGVDKDAPPKKPFFRFFDIFFRKFYKLMRLNFLFIIFNLPATIITVFLIYIPVIVFAQLTEVKIDLGMLQDLNNLSLNGWLLLVILLTSIPIFTTGPSQAGMTYVLRNYAKEEHAFIWSDFIAKAKQNFKLSLKVSILDMFIGILLMMDFAIYFAATSQRPIAVLANLPNFLVILVAIILGFVTIFYFIIHLYIYPMMVTFDISFKQLLRNSAIFAMLKWLPNLGIILLDAVLIFIPLFLFPGRFSILVPVTLYLFFTPAFIGLINNFYVYPILKKYMIDNSKDIDKEEIDETAMSSGGRFVDGKFTYDEDKD